MQQLDEKPLDLVLLNDPRVLQVIDLEGNCAARSTKQSIIGTILCN